MCMNIDIFVLSCCEVVVYGMGIRELIQPLANVTVYGCMPKGGVSVIFVEIIIIDFAAILPHATLHLSYVFFILYI